MKAGQRPMLGIENFMLKNLRQQHLGWFYLLSKAVRHLEEDPCCARSDMVGRSG